MNPYRPKVRRAACAAYIHDYLTRHTGATLDGALTHWFNMHPQHKAARYRAALPYVDAAVPLITAEDTHDLPIGTILHSLTTGHIHIRIPNRPTGHMVMRWETVNTGEGKTRHPVLIDTDGPFELLHRPKETTP